MTSPITGTLADAAKLDEKDTISQANILELLDGFDAADWALFNKSLAGRYPNVSTARPYARQCLETYTSKSARTYILDEVALYNYLKGFLTIAECLVEQKEITDDDLVRYFWRGFHPRTRASLDEQLVISILNGDISEPCGYVDVFRAGRYLFGNQAVDSEPGPRTSSPENLWVDGMEKEEKEEGGKISDDEEGKAMEETRDTEGPDALIQKLTSLMR